MLRAIRDFCAGHGASAHLFRAFVLLFPLLHALPHTTAVTALWSVGILTALVLEEGIDALFVRDALSVTVLAAAALLCAYGLLGRGRWIDGLALSLFLLLFVPTQRYLDRALLRWGTVPCFITVGYGLLRYGRTKMPAHWVDRRLFADVGGRVTSFFGNPNVLSVYLLFWFPVLLSMALDAKERTPFRVWCGGVAASVFLCTLLTWTRGAWLGMLLQLLLFMIFFNTRTRKTLFWSPFLLPMLPLVPASVTRRFLSIGTLADSSNNYRFHTWRGTLRMILEHPFGVGVGERAFCAVYPRYAVMGTETVMHAHSLPLQIAAELGTVGVFLFFFLCVSALLCAKRRGHIPDALPLAGLLVMGLSDHLWYAPSMVILFVLSLSLANVTPLLGRNRRENVSVLHENA